MSSPKTYESDLLANVEALVATYANQFPKSKSEARLQLLEATASRLGGFSLDEFHAQFGIDTLQPSDTLLQVAAEVVDRIRLLQISPALALSVLARESLDQSSRRTTGAYHTDFRLATRLAQLAAPKFKPRAKVVDPACGAGILLVALTIEACGPDRRKIARWLSESVYAADLSPMALRGCLLSLAALTNDLRALRAMRSKWIVGDSLMASDSTWTSDAPEGFDVVIGNPPWEKIKLTRHEYLRAQGQTRHYGSDTCGIDQTAFAKEKHDLATYSRQLVERYPMLISGEPDLYIAFTELFERLCKQGGTMAVLVPAGLIRSQGTEEVRRQLLEVSDRVSISVIDNRARFFEIDTRFKFLALVCTKAQPGARRRKPITLRHEKGTHTGLELVGVAHLGRDTLSLVRPDLSLPEVRSNNEWRIFHKVVAAGVDWRDKTWGWNAEFCREVDMTRERHAFRLKSERAGIPVIEGRMVQQHRFGAKGHVSGTGRRAHWETFALGSSQVAPQFYLPLKDIPSTARLRMHQVRGGFCDITGQTNERSMMAAVIPAGVICGNKVPTVLFPDDPSEDRLLVWCSVMNSFCFDWLIRRIITTTVNYFLLLSLPMPRIARDGLPWRRIVSAAKTLHALDRSGGLQSDFLRASELRTDIDVSIAIAYGLKLEDLIVMLEDFPLLDRGQPPLHGEAKSTVTRDTFLSAAAKRLKQNSEPWSQRLREARNLGAMAYVPSEFAGINDTRDGRRVNAD